MLAFKSPSYINDSNLVNYAALVDVNGDGILDIVLRSYYGGVATLLGTGDGAFAAPSSVATGPYNLALVADLNNDGRPDYIFWTFVSPLDPNYVADENFVVWLNTPAGFVSSTYPGSAMTSIYGVDTVADVNGDGFPDLIGFTSGSSSSPVGVRYNDGTGHFGPIVAIPSGAPLGGGSSVLVGDLNGDGIPDIVATFGSSFSIILGTGNGNFAPPITVSGSGAGTGALADLNQDGNLDLVVVSSNASGEEFARVFLGDGHGHLTASGTYLISTEAFSQIPSVTVADLNGDGIPDLAYTDSDGVYVLLGDGFGRFANGILLPIALNSAPLIASDLTGDGLTDLIVNTHSNTGLAVLTNVSTAAANSFVASTAAGSLWSNGANWSLGAGPETGDSATIGQASIDDTPNLNLTSITATYNGSVDVTSGVLTLGTFAGGPNTELAAGGAGVTVSVSNVVGTGAVLGAVGAKALLIDGSSMDAGEIYAVQSGGALWLGAVPSAASVFQYSGAGEIVLFHPGAVNTMPLTGVARGDVIEVPGSKTEGIVFGPSSVTINTDTGSYAFTQVSYNGLVNAFTTMTDPATGLQAITFQSSPKSDFNRDGMSDIVYQNDNGAIVVDTQANLTLTGAASVANPGAAWHVVGTGDLNGDGYSDILLQSQDGGVVDYLMNGSAVASVNLLGVPDSPYWHVRGTADFNGDGNADVLLENDDGRLVIWNTNGTSVTGVTLIGQLPAGYTVEGIADLNGDGSPDIVLQSTDGSVAAYLMNGTHVVAAPYLGNPGAGWSVVGTGDYNSDGLADIVLHNDNGTNIVWTTNGASVTGAALLNASSGDWNNVLPGVDLNGDGHYDLVLQNANGTTAGFTTNGAGGLVAGAQIVAPFPQWHAVSEVPMQFLDYAGTQATTTATPGRDVFGLNSYTNGVHAIVGFDPAQDLIALSSTAFSNYAAVQAHEAPYMGGTLIALSSSANVVIQGVTPSQLDSSNFVFR